MGDRRNKKTQDDGSMKENDIYQLQKLSSSLHVEQTHELKTFETPMSDTHSISTTTTQIAEFELDTPSNSEVDFPQMPFTTLKMGENYQHNLGVEDLSPRP